jgi:ADP-ribosylglycohydrolase
LGVPVEFSSRAEVQANPVTEMRGHGTHHQPAGTWSDDSSLLLCSADSLLHHEFNTEDMGKRFVQWLDHALWSPWGDVFDVGMTTCDALRRISDGITAEQAGGRDEQSNGNGSLMRILPVALRFAGQPVEQLRSYLERASAITHGHARSQMACVFYGLVTRELAAGSHPRAAIASARPAFLETYEQVSEAGTFRHILNDDFCSLPEGEIVSTGYVLHTLHASLWCLLTTNNFEECVLKAVNLGGDTDTTGCVAGGLAGLAYGVNSIPTAWKRQLARHADLEQLFNAFAPLCENVA